MIIIAANLTAKPGAGDKFLEIVGALAKGSSGEAVCRRFEVYQSIDDPNEYMMYEEWEDMDDAARAAHRQSEYYQHFDRERDNIVAKQSIKKYLVNE